MQLFRISQDDQAWLSANPETAMGLQVVGGARDTYEDWVLAFGGRVGAFARELLPGGREREPLDYLRESWLSPRAHHLEKSQQVLFDEWLGRLGEIERPLRRDRIVSFMEFKLFPIGPFPRPPQPDHWTYGHLPFICSTGPNDVYYRWEPWPTSNRIDQAAGVIAPGTFTAPMSEIPFMPTGFSAVARLALPGLLPACFRWEVRPPPETLARCGASVPMFGQSGGGVEVAFQAGFHNIGPIANPVMLSAL